MSSSAKSTASGRKRSAKTAGLEPVEGLEADAAPQPLAFPLEPLAVAYMHSDEFAINGDEDQKYSKVQEKAWNDLDEERKDSRTNDVVRYCILQQCTGNGIIEEADIKKYVMRGENYHPRQLLKDAAVKLKAHFGFDLIRVRALPTRENWDDRGKRELMTVEYEPKWMLRNSLPVNISVASVEKEYYAPPGPLKENSIEQAEMELKPKASSSAAKDDDDDDDEEFDEGKPIKAFRAKLAALRNQSLAELSINGLTPAQLGLLGLVCSFIAGQSDKCIREDKLWELLNKLDEDKFRLDSKKEDAMAMVEAMETEAQTVGFNEKDKREKEREQQKASASSSSSSSAASGEAATSEIKPRFIHDRSVFNWRQLISTEWPQKKILMKRTAEQEGLLTEEQAAEYSGVGNKSDDKNRTERHGDPRVAYRFGPLARQALTVTAPLSIVETVTGRYVEESAMAGALGVEVGTYDDLMKNDEAAQEVFRVRSKLSVAAKRRELGMADLEDEGEEAGAAGDEEGSSSSSKGAKGKGSKGKKR